MTEKPEESGAKKKKVLVVDDDAGVLALVLRWLSDAGFEVVACQRVETGRTCLEAWRPDILVTDVRVAGMNGLHLAVLAEQRAPMRSVVMTGFNDPVLAADAKNLKAPFLIKPVAREDLIAAVRASAEPA